MASYIASSRNRYYVSMEQAYGQSAPISAANRFPANRLHLRQAYETIKRPDKSGTRTLQSQLVTGRKNISFDIASYLCPWSGNGTPAYGPLFQAACGASPFSWPGVSVNSLIGQLELVTATEHNLTVGCAVSWLGEIRFVSGVLNPYTFTINAPFSTSIQSGDLLGPTVTYKLSSNLPSLTLYDYWESQNSIDRVIPGAAVNSMHISVNGDNHEFTFSGAASDIVDARSFSPGASGMAVFPNEPTLSIFNNTGVPGHLGQVWLGANSTQFFTMTAADVRLVNNLDLRRQEFGLIKPVAVIPGEREVTYSFTVFAQDDRQTTSLYDAARSRSPIPAMLQLGTQQGQLMGVYLPQVIPVVPQYEDSQIRLRWEFNNNRVQGGLDDELSVAFA